MAQLCTIVIPFWRKWNSFQGKIIDRLLNLWATIVDVLYDNMQCACLAKFTNRWSISRRLSNGECIGKKLSFICNIIASYFSGFICPMVGQYNTAMLFAILLGNSVYILCFCVCYRMPSGQSPGQMRPKMHSRWYKFISTTLLKILGIKNSGE